MLFIRHLLEIVLEDEDYIVNNARLESKNGKLIFEGDILDNDFVVIWADFWELQLQASHYVSSDRTLK